MAQMKDFGAPGGELGLAKLKTPKKKPNHVADLLNKLYGAQATDYALALLAQKQAAKTIGGQFDKAISSAGSGATAAKTSVMNNQAQALAGLQTGLQQSGLANTTVNANLQGGLYSQGSQNLAQVDQALAQAVAGLQAQKGMALGGAQSGLAGLYQDKFGALMGVGGLHFNYLNKPKQKKKSGLGSLLGGVAGSFLGPLGGAAGAAAGDALFGDD